MIVFSARFYVRRLYAQFLAERQRSFSAHRWMLDVARMRLGIEVKT